MTTEFVREKRLGYRVPRSIILPPYIAVNPYFVEWVNAIDTVWASKVDSKIDVIANIRNMFVTNPMTEQKIVNGEMLDFNDWSMPEREILVKQVNMLGMKLKSAGVLTDANYQTIARYIGIYWFGKGTESFIEFINFCLSSNLQVRTMWSKNSVPGEYTELTQENDDGTPPGTPIWEGGIWFPTTHVEISANGGLGNLTAQTLAEFFYEIANYNLVLHAIENSFDMPIVDSLSDLTATTAKIVAIGLVREHSMVMSNFGQYGATPPPILDIQPAKPTKVLTDNAPNFSSGYLLTSPNSWFKAASGRRYIVYDVAQRVITENQVMPTKVMGTSTLPNPMDGAGYTMIMGPSQYTTVPGGSNSPGRIPVWTTVPTVKDTAGVVTTRTVGNRENYVVNPDGWEEITPGLWTPYWLD